MQQAFPAQSRRRVIDTLRDDLLIRAADKLIRTDAVIDRAELVDEPWRLQHATEASENVKMRSRIAADN